MILSESWMGEIHTSSLMSEDWKRGHGSRAEARSESDGTATGPLRRRASPRLYSPRELMSFLGLVPSEHSSGPHWRQGAITKAGNGP